MIHLKWTKPLTIFFDWRQIYAIIAFKTLGFTYSACGPFTKHCGRIQNFRETFNLKHLHRNELDKACFALYAGYYDSEV